MDMDGESGLLESRLWRLGAAALILLLWAFPLTGWGLLGFLIVLSRVGGNAFLPLFSAFSLMSGVVLSGVAVWVALSPAGRKLGGTGGDCER